MIIFRSIAEIDKNIEKTAVALGNFDGIHIGHQALIKKAVEVAKAKGIKSAVFTFTNHPRNVMSGKNVVKNVLYEEDKFKVLEDMGIDYLFTLDFDDAIMKQTPESFVDDNLLGAFNMDTAICGFNFTYGYKAGGTAETLKAESIAKNFDVHVMNPVTLNDQVVSSTLIRGRIEAGHVDEALQFLGRPYCVKGEVLHGNQLGRTMGFPTCNILVDDAMVAPANGVYVTRCMVDGQWYPAVTNVGHKPTVGNYEKNVETNILDFDSNIYGKEICVEFYEKIRDEKKFETLDELIAEIGRNKDYARNFHKNMKAIGIDTIK